MREQINNWIKNKEYTKAEQAYMNAIELAEKEQDKKNLFAYNIYLGILYTLQKRYSESKAIFDQFYETLTLNFAEKWNGKEMIQTYSYFNENMKALQYNDAYLNHHPRDINALQIRGKLLYLLGKYGSAHLALDAAIKLGGNNQLLFYSMGLVKKAIKENDEAFFYFEKAYDKGSDAAIYEIIKLLFERTGNCDYLNCKDPCCKNLIINGTNGQPVKSNQDFENLTTSDQKHDCFIHESETKKGLWTFSCKNLNSDNSCNNHINRPGICHDYPSHPIMLKQACSYSFRLKPEMAFFTSPRTCQVICDLLDAYGFIDETSTIKDQNADILAD